MTLSEQQWDILRVWRIVGRSQGVGCLVLAAAALEVCCWLQMLGDTCRLTHPPEMLHVRGICMAHPSPLA